MNFIINVLILNKNKEKTCYFSDEQKFVKLAKTESVAIFNILI